MEKFTLANTSPIIIISVRHQIKKWLLKKRKSNNKVKIPFLFTVRDRRMRSANRMRI